MPQSAGDRSKLFTTVKPAKPKHRLRQEDWHHLETIFGLPLSPETKKQIKQAQRSFAAVGAMHSKKRKISVSSAERALSDWIKASGRLRKAFGKTTSSKTLTRAEIVAMFATEKTRIKLGAMQPLVFVNYVLRAAIGAAQAALDEIKSHRLSPELERDTWLAWVKLIELAVSQAGIKVSASSSHQTIRESPFVKAIIYLQNRLPKLCKKYGSYESVAKNVQLARRKFKDLDSIYLDAVITGWGTGVLKDYAADRIKVVLDELMKGETRLETNK